VRAVGVPFENCFDISWVTSLNGHELHRFPYPSAAEETRIRRERNDGTLTLEAPLRVSQIVVEPVLKQAAEESSNVEVRFGWRMEGFVQDDTGVTATLRSMATGEELQVRSKFLVGCDGGGSTVRAQLGIEYEGHGNVANMYMVYFRSTAHDVLQRFGIAWHSQTGRGLMIAQDDDELWLVHTFWPPDVDRSKLDPREVLENWVGCRFDYEILIANPWSGHYLIAKRFSKGRVFIAGDACHQLVPAGGYGMNSGVADAANLGWKIAAVLQGWGGQALLDSYDAERRSVAKMSEATSEAHLKVRFAIAALYAEAGDLSGMTPEVIERRSMAIVTTPLPSFAPRMATRRNSIHWSTHRQLGPVAACRTSSSKTAALSTTILAVR
jgi:2-polyprenyl-6-methoxyphenol hydroxylase-like FAD-dependent oxidoreductase